MPAPKDPVKRAEWIRNMSASRKGKPKSESWRKNIGESNKGKHSRPCPEHVKERFRVRFAGAGNPMFGVHQVASPATRLKMSAKRKNVPFTKSHCENISKSLMNHPVSQKVLDRVTGENSIFWKGGISFEPYCPKFNNEFKERVRAFFGHTCQLCGHVWQEGEVKLSVHHVNYNKKACCEQSVIPLFVPVCSGKCHAKTNHRREFYETYFTELIMTKYNGQCYLPKEEPK